MIKIDAREPIDKKWRIWRDECATARDALIDEMTQWNEKWATNPLPHDAKLKAKEKPKINDRIYKGQKEDFYMDPQGPFRGRCAYCEVDIYSSHHGDIEHFRPKGAVKGSDGKSIRVVINGSEQDHPGYYWLAYDWENLLPSCQLCNEPSSARSDGRPIGKRNFFPLKNNAYATRAGEETHEDPLFINPCKTEPDDHLGLDSTGVLYSKTDAGQACIDYFGLNERGLPNERRTSYKYAKNIALELVGEIGRDPNSQRVIELLEEVQNLQCGSRPFTLANRLAIKETLGPIQAVLRQLAGI